jgi:hypothetical protein
MRADLVPPSYWVCRDRFLSPGSRPGLFLARMKGLLTINVAIRASRDQSPRSRCARSLVNPVVKATCRRRSRPGSASPPFGGTVEEECCATGADRDLQPVTGPSVVGAICTEDDRPKLRIAIHRRVAGRKRAVGSVIKSALRASAAQCGTLTPRENRDVVRLLLSPGRASGLLIHAGQFRQPPGLSGRASRACARSGIGRPESPRPAGVLPEPFEAPA